LFGLSDPQHDSNDRFKKEAVVVYMCFNERALTRSEGRFEFSSRAHTKIITEGLITQPHEARRFVTPGNQFYCLNLYIELFPHTFSLQANMDIEQVVAVAPDAAPAPPPMDIILTWIGIEQPAIRERIRTEGFESFDDLLAMREKDIRGLSESYYRRTIADGRIIFGLRKTRYMIGLIHWVQDFVRIG
jgi:hypothetical protein